MYLERLLQINLATMAALGALLLGMGERRVEIPLVVGLAAVASVWLTDATGKFRVSQGMANLLMLLGAAFSFYNLYPPNSELQTMTFALFLIYIQIILMFQKKDAWKYWLLVMLSLLEVMVAALFSQGIFFGVLLALYMLLGFSTMTLLMLHRQWMKFQNPEPQIPRLPSPAPRPQKLHRWPLLARTSEFSNQPAGGGHAGVGADLYRRLGWMSANTLGMTLVLFFALPRFGHFDWQGTITQPNPLVGFTDDVQLGELGQIVENRTEVLQVKFLNDSDDASQQLHGEIYLQGALMMYYKQGKWIAGAPCREQGEEQLDGKKSMPWFVKVTRQEFKIGPLDRKELFFVSPFIAVKANSEIKIDWARQRLLRDSHRCLRQFDYTLGTTAIVNGEQSPLVPAGENDEIDGAKSFSEKAFPRITALAKKWIADARLTDADRLAKARHLEKMLASSGDFQYSLVGQNRNPDIDPIEDFVSEHRKGHCEYFATALTLMLRSQKIPARMVSGFKCDGSDWNAIGNCYQVRQLHAHTWVEVFLDPEQLEKFPPDSLHGKNYWTFTEQDRLRPENGRAWKSGAWMRLDPTPAGDADHRAGLFSSMRRGMDWLDFAWSNYVVQLDFDRQRDAIYQPIARAVKKAWDELTSPSRWRAMADSLALALYLDHLGREAQWIVLALVALLIAAVVAVAVWLLFRLVRRLFARWTGNHRARRMKGRRVEIEFYRKLETLLARHGLVRAPAQTQLEFAAAAGASLAAVFGKNRVAPLPSLVAEAFYLVRFGRQPLDNLQVQTVEQALAELAEIGKSVGGDSRRRL
jgi:protein-glutamine gamma-glutamyltransferase